MLNSVAFLPTTGMIAVLLTSSAVAAEQSSISDLSDVSDIAVFMAAKDSCGLRIDDRAIEAWLRDHADASDVDLAHQLGMSVMDHLWQYDHLEAPAQAAYCTGAKLTAEQYGLLPK